MHVRIVAHAVTRSRQQNQSDIRRCNKYASHFTDLLTCCFIVIVSGFAIILSAFGVQYVLVSLKYAYYIYSIYTAWAKK